MHTAWIQGWLLIPKFSPNVEHDKEDIRTAVVKLGNHLNMNIFALAEHFKRGL